MLVRQLTAAGIWRATDGSRPPRASFFQQATDLPSQMLGKAVRSYQEAIVLDLQMIQAIERKAKNGTLEVEHILKLAKSPSTEVATVLRDLSVKYNWQHHPCFPNVPLATWAEVTSEYCLNGFDGLVRLARETGKTSFVFAQLEEIGSPQSLYAALSIGRHLLSAPERDLETSYALAGVLNSFGLKGILAEPLELTRFLENLLRLSTHEHQLGTTMCALRWYGNAASVSLVREVKPMQEHWESVRRAAIRAIKKRSHEQSVSRSN